MGVFCAAQLVKEQTELARTPNDTAQMSEMKSVLLLCVDRDSPALVGFNEGLCAVVDAQYDSIWH
jgi:hypothetical protein